MHAATARRGRGLSRGELLALGTGVGSVAAAKTMPFFWAHGFNSYCPFYVATGIPCPFCGGTRGMVAMGQGNVAAAAYHYPLAPLLFVAAVVAAIYVFVVLATGKRISKETFARNEKKLAWVLGLALAFNWFLKIAFLGY